MTILQKIIWYVRRQRKERFPIRFDGRNEQPVSLLANPHFLYVRRKTQFLRESHGLVGAISKYGRSLGGGSGHGPRRRPRRYGFNFSGLLALHRVSLKREILFSICLAYGEINMHSIGGRGRHDGRLWSA